MPLPTLQIQILLQWWGEQRAVVIWASSEVLQKSCLLKWWRKSVCFASFVNLCILLYTDDLFLYVHLPLPELFSVSRDKAVHIMDVVAGKLVKRIPKAHRYCLISKFSKFQKYVEVHSWVCLGNLYAHMLILICKCMFAMSHTNLSLINTN